VADSVVTATPQAERIVWLDVLRGAALFGIAQINFPSFASGALPITALYPADASPMLQTFAAMLLFFVSAKFYPIFAFLFGYGHWLQRERLNASGNHAEAVLQRRYLVLLGLGMLHGAGLFFGDILTIYAIAGLVLLLQHRYGRRDTRSQVLNWAGISAALAIVSLLFQDTAPADVHLSWVQLLGHEAEALHTGDFASVLGDRALLYGVMQLQDLASFLPQVLMFMSAGLWAGEARVLQQAGQHLALFRRCIAIGVLVGVPVNLALVIAESEIVLQVAAPLALAETLNDLAFFLSLAYLGLFGIYVARARVPATWLLFFAAMGRLSLTNYLTQSLVMMLLWYRFSDHLTAFGVVPAMALCGFVTCVAQGFGSLLWLKHFQQGPAEALWRRLTYTSVAAGVIR
jgi:uncharacterized protein